MLDVAGAACLLGDLADQEQSAAARLPVVRLEGLGAVRMIVLDGHPDPLGADGHLHRYLRGQQRRVPHGVGDQLGDDQQQAVHDLLMDGDALADQQVAYGVPGLRDGDVDRGSGEAPDSFVGRLPGGATSVGVHGTVPTLVLDSRHGSSLGNARGWTGLLTRSRHVSAAS